MYPGEHDDDAAGETSPWMSPLDIYRGKSLVILAWICGSVFFEAALGPPAVGLIHSLGGNALHIGILGALPPLAGIVQPIVARILEGRSERKGIFLISGIIHRALWLPLAFLPILLLPGPLAVWSGLAIALVSFLFGAATSTVWLSWMGDLIPEGDRGRFLGRRNTLGKMAGLVVAIAFGAHLGMNPQPSHLAAVFACAAAMGIADIVIHRWVAEPRPAHRPRLGSFLNQLLMPLRHRSYRSLILFWGSWFLAYTIGWAFYYFYAVEKLGLSYFTVAFFYVVLYGLALLSMFWVWGFFVDRYGNRPVLTVCSFGLGMVPLCYLFTSPGVIWPVPVIVVLNGALWAGIQITMMNLQIGLPPPAYRATYIGTFLLVTGIPSAIGPLLGGVIARSVEGISETVFGFPFAEIKVIFVISGVLTILSACLVFTIEEPHGRPVSEMWKAMRMLHPLRLFYGLYLSDQAEREDLRLKAVRSLSLSGSPLAFRPLVEALDDPDPSVRREAMQALAQVRDPRVVTALIEMVKDVSSTAVEDLPPGGEDPARIPDGLQSDDPRNRQEAKDALADLASGSVSDSAVKSLRSEGDPLVVGAATRALAQLGVVRAIGAVIPAIPRTGSPGPQGELARAVANLMGRKGEFYRYLRREARVPGRGAFTLARQIRREVRVAPKGKAEVSELLGSIERFREDPSLAVAAIARLGRDTVESFALRELPEGSAPADYGWLVAELMLRFPRMGTRAWFIELTARRWAEVVPIEALLAGYALLTLVRSANRGGAG